MKKVSILGAGVLLALGLGACQDTLRDHNEPLSTGLGNAVNHNSAVAIVDPVPANATAGAPDYSGKREALVIDRYETGVGTSVAAPDTGTDQ